MTAINWGAFLLVLLVSLGAAVAAVSLFAVGVRLLATPVPGVPVERRDPGPDDPGEDDPISGPSRPAGATSGAVVAFVVAGLVAATGVFLIVH